MIETRLATPALALVAALSLLAGCGGGGGSGSDLARVAPPSSPLFIEGVLQPSGALKGNVEELAEAIAGVDDLGGLIVSELEQSAGESGEGFDYATDVKPWLGERAAFFFRHYDGDDFEGTGAVVQSTDTDATEAFIDKLARESDEPVRDGSYEGIDYKATSDSVVGIVDESLLIGDDEPTFKAAVDAADGDSLADVEAYSDAVADASGESLADVYIDIGGLVEQSGNEVEEPALRYLKGSGIDPNNATALASIVPGSEQVAVDISSDLGGAEPPSGDASELLGSLPGDAFAAVAVSGFGEQLQEALDELDKEGVSGSIPPGQLKKGVKEFGIDLEGLVDSLRDAAIFATGRSEGSLSGALVMTAEGPEAREAVEEAVKVVRAFNVGGVSVLGGGVSGFSVRGDELGSKPLVVAAADGRMAIGYGAPATLSALRGASDEAGTLSESPAYEDAVAALEGTPISGFADGQAALALADALVPSSESGFEEAKRYLKSIRFLALGASGAEDRATAKLILGVR